VVSLMYNPKSNRLEAGSNIVEHELHGILAAFIRTFPDNKESNLSLSNTEFHDSYGLEMKVPSHWPLLDAIVSVINEFTQVPAVRKPGSENKKVILFYPTVDVYNQVSPQIDSSVEINYVLRADMFMAVYQASEDARTIQRLNEEIKRADLIVWYGSPTRSPNVVDYVKRFCSGCLLVVQ